MEMPILVDTVVHSQPGAIVELGIQYGLAEDIFDGANNYAAGSYEQRITVQVEP